MKARYIMVFLLLFSLLISCSEEADKSPVLSKEAGQFPGLSMRIPYFIERLHSNRWQVRYCLLYDLSERDAEKKRVLELLINDENNKVAQQAHMAYLGFIDIDKTLFRPELYFYGIVGYNFLGPGPVNEEDYLEALRRDSTWIKQYRDDLWKLRRIIRENENYLRRAFQNVKPGGDR